MTKSHVVAVVVIFSSMIGWTYRTHLSPAAQAGAAATRFFQAVAAGDETAVAALLVPDPPEDASWWVEQHRGKHFPSGKISVSPIETECGIAFRAPFTWWHPDGIPHARMIFLKKVDGRWLVVHGQQGPICR